MFRPEREFNIISGEVAPFLGTQRSLSCKTQLERFNKYQPKPLKLQKLGRPKDQKLFQYAYFQKSQPVLQNKQKILPYNSDIKPKLQPTMMNYVSTAYNIINHSSQMETSKYVKQQMFLQKMPQVNKKSPLTQLIHKGRPLAPNYHENYSSRVQKRQFYRKGPSICSTICDIQKSYGPYRYFRKFK